MGIFQLKTVVKVVIVVIRQKGKSDLALQLLQHLQLLHPLQHLQPISYLCSLKLALHERKDIGYWR